MRRTTARSFLFAFIGFLSFVSLTSQAVAEEVTVAAPSTAAKPAAKAVDDGASKKKSPFLNARDQARYDEYLSETERPLGMDAWIRQQNTESNSVVVLEILSGLGLAFSLFLASDRPEPGSFSVAQPIGIVGSIGFGTVFLTTCIIDALDIGNVAVRTKTAKAETSKDATFAVTPMMAPNHDGEPGFRWGAVGHWVF